jgi:glycosyltransferase involved in cell wall biosynthesis
MVPLEAMACGTPVIAYGKWGALETVVEWKTGVFFKEQTVESLNDIITQFETMKFDNKAIRKHVEKFDTKVFKKKILSFVEERTDL